MMHVAFFQFWKQIGIIFLVSKFLNIIKENNMIVGYTSVLQIQ